MEREFDVYEQTELSELAQFLKDRHLAGRRKSRMYEESEPDCECRFCGDSADASDCDLHGARRPMGTVWVSTPCSCQDGDTRTCFLHGEAA